MTPPQVSATLRTPTRRLIALQLAALAIVAANARAVAKGQYVVTDLMVEPWTYGPAAISASGQVVGESGLHAFLWQSEVVTDLGAPGSGPISLATAINDVGQVVVNDQFYGVFLWQNGVTTDLGINGYGNGINNSGQVVGFLFVGGQQHAFLWDRGVTTDLGTLGGPESVAWDVNAAGQVVGWASTAGGARHADRLRDVGHPAAFCVPLELFPGAVGHIAQ